MKKRLFGAFLALALAIGAGTAAGVISGKKADVAEAKIGDSVTYVWASATGTGVDEQITATSDTDASGVIGYEAFKGGGTSNPAVNANAVRLYQIGSGNSYGGYLQINGNGNTLTSVTFQSTMASSYSTSTNTTAGSGLTTSASVTANTDVTVSNINAENLLIYCMGTSSGTRLYVSKISVTYTVVVDPNAASSVALDKTFSTVKMGSALTLTPTVSPTTATDKTVSWTSSVPGVATVTSGAVSPVATGSTVITATTTDGGYTATCTVVVTAKAGTAADPFNVLDANNICTATGTTATADKYYVSGDVTEITITSGGTAGGTLSDGTNTLTLYKFYDVGTGSVNFTDTTKIKVTDTVVLLTTLINYNGTTLEAQYGNLVSVTSNTTLSSVVISGSITANQYVGEAWNVSELVVTAVYANGTEVVVTSAVTLTCNPTSPSAAGLQSFTVDVTYNTVAATQKTFSLTVLAATVTVSDAITFSDMTFAKTGAYSNFTATKTSSAEYVGNAYNATTISYIQMKTASNSSGIVSTQSGGKRIKSVAVAINKNTPTINVFGKNTPYTGSDASALNSTDDTVKGTQIATLNTTTLSYDIVGDYRYVGLTSNSGTAYLDSITIVWEQYTAAEVAAEVKTMAGGWTNNVGTANCASHYATAKDMVLSLPATELTTFKTSTDTEIVSARTTYELWCAKNNDSTPYSGSIVSGAFEDTGLISESDKVDLVVILLASLMGIAAIGGIFFYNRKRNSI